LLFQKLGWATTYWTIEDTLDAEQYHGEILARVPCTQLVPVDLQHHEGFRDSISVPFKRGPVDQPIFSLMPPFEWGGTVVFLMLQLLMYFGCQPIYLLGLDHRWTMIDVQTNAHQWVTVADHNHFDAQYWPRGFRSFPPDVQVMERGFEAARVACRR